MIRRTAISGDVSVLRMLRITRSRASGERRCIFRDLGGLEARKLGLLRPSGSRSAARQPEQYQEAFHETHCLLVGVTGLDMGMVEPNLLDYPTISTRIGNGLAAVSKCKDPKESN
jgi:hypothetical protein